MARQYYKDSTTGNMIPLGVKVEDTLPVGTEVDYNGSTIPEGWEEVPQKITVSLNDASNFYYNENYVIGNEIQLAGDVRVNIPSGSYAQAKLFTVPSQYKPVLDNVSDQSIRFPMIASNGAFGYAYVNSNGEVYAQIPSNPSSANAVYINIRYRFI